MIIVIRYYYYYCRRPIDPGDERTGPKRIVPSHPLRPFPVVFPTVIRPFSSPSRSLLSLSPSRTVWPRPSRADNTRLRWTPLGFHGAYLHINCRIPSRTFPSVASRPPGESFIEKNPESSATAMIREPKDTRIRPKHVIDFLIRTRSSRFRRYPTSLCSRSTATPPPPIRRIFTAREGYSVQAHGWD